MLYVSYVLSEIRRRSGRTFLTVLGLAVGVALVIVVNALSNGLNRAQASVLAPLTGVGTDMSVTRPLTLSTSGGNPFARLTPAEQQELRKENGGTRVGLRNLAKPGKHFNVDRFTSAGNLSFPSSEVTHIRHLSGVSGAAAVLALTDLHISGTVPKTASSTSGGFGRPGSGGFGRPGGGFAGPGAGDFGPRSINFASRTVTGIDQTHPNLAPMTPSQIVSGHYFKSGDGPYSAVLSSSYAAANNYKVGTKVAIGGESFTVIGIASAPLGGTSSDAYVELSTLQKLWGISGRVNTIEVQAASGSDVARVQKEIQSSFSGAQVTTAKDLAKRIGGSLTDAKNLSGTLGTALEIVGLLAAVLIAILLTLASVAKRTREIGTLRAIGWSRALVVRQISLESIAQGVAGGVLGVILGVVAALVITGLGITLRATVAPAQSSGPFGFGRFGGGFGRFGQGAVNTGSTLIHLTAPTDAPLIAAAIGLAVAGGLVAGAVGGMRAARLRPAEALRTVE